MCDICRRDFLRGAAAFTAAGTFSSPLMAQTGNAGTSRLPSRGEFTIQGAHIMTMDSALGDIAGGSVHVRNGEIIAVGKDVAGGFKEEEVRAMLLDVGFSDVAFTYYWYLGQASLVNDASKSRDACLADAALVDAALQRVMPLSRNLYKYIGFVATK